MALRENPSSSRQTGLINDPAPAYIYENVQIWVPLPVIPVPGHTVLTTPMDEPTLVPSPVPTSMTTPPPLIQENYNFGGDQANRNAYAGSQYIPPNFHRSLENVFDYQFPETEYYTSLTPIDRAYQISRKINCMGGAPRLPGLLPCPYGTDAIACASYAAGQN